MKTIRLREGKERSLLRRHPWVFQGSVAKGSADAGETVLVEADDGRFLAWGSFSPTSMIRVRAWSFDEAERIDLGGGQGEAAEGFDGVNEQAGEMHGIGVGRRSWRRGLPPVLMIPATLACIA